MTSPLVASRGINSLGRSDDYSRPTAATEARLNKRQQRTQTENDNPARPSAEFAAQPPGVVGLASRRRSGAQKAPLGPRPQDPSKRITSDGSALNAMSGNSTFTPSSSSEPFLGLSARKDSFHAGRPAPRHLAPTAPSAPAPPPVSSPSFDFDSFQDNAKALSSSSSNKRDPSLRKSLRYDDSTTSSSEVFDPATRRMTLLSATTPIEPALHTRQRSQALRAAQLSTASATAGATTAATASAKVRRQSHFPPSSAASATSIDSRQPRKSVGPGFTIATARDRPRDASADGGVTLTRQVSGSRPRQSQAVGPSLTEGDLQSTRKIKALSMQPPQTTRPRAGSNTTLKRNPPSFGSDGNGQQLVKPPIPRTGTPPSSGRRRPGTPGYVSGLGARTISPTDARRMKRTSTHPPPLPVRSPSPELPSIVRANETPPPPLPRHKSITPVSARATPDPIQRLDSGRSLSSRSSYSSCRPGSSSMPNRSSITLPSASRNLHSSSGPADGEFVPPVPKIPLAFESPSESSTEKQFFADVVVPPLPKEYTPRSSISGESKGVTKDSEIPKNASVPGVRQSRRLTLGSRPDASKTAQNVQKISHQAPRLPPLNLQPLSNPTEARIAEMSRRAPISAPGQSTPPPKRDPAKTPTTPMTASRATFASQDYRLPPDYGIVTKMRSTTSYTNSRAPSSVMEQSLSESADDSNSAKDLAAQSQSPGPSLMGSQSRLKPKGENKVDGSRPREAPRPNGSSNEGTTGGLIGRLSRAASKSARNSQVPSTATTSSEHEPTTNSKRKLSIGWRRSSSKASHNNLGQDEDGLPPTLTSDAAPPRLPTVGQSNTSTRPSPRLSLSSDGTKFQSLGSGLAEAGSSTSLTGSVKSTRSGGATQEPTPNSMRSTSSFLTPMQRILGPRSTSGATKNATPPPGMDRNDVAAEEEMRKLASKKKEFESAAREVDSLRKRASPREAASPEQAAKSSSLTLFERGEIVDYHGIFFTGNGNAAKIKGDLSEKANNFGFDDERGDYNIVMGDHLAYRYEVVDLLGKGSFGQVVRCIDHKHGRLVAIKIIRNKKRFHQQALIEVNILQKIKDWDPDKKHSMINFTQSFYFRGHLCISTELLGINLYEFIKAHDFRGFSLKLIRRFAKQMLGSLCLLQGKRVIHCDLKPENILLAHPLHSEIKVIDFGSSCFENEKVYTYIQSRFYRSPEVILGMSYGLPIDMWSFGCILAELYTGYPIFPGENEQEQLSCIMEIFGPPEKHLIERSSRKKLFFDSLGKPRVTVSSKGKRRRPSSKTLQQALKCDDEAFLDFITRCLRWDPERRLKPDDATNHEFITGVKKPAGRPRSQFVPPTRGTASRGSSPAKRIPTTQGLQTPMHSRPLPETPATALRNGIPVIGDEGPNTSPLKAPTSIGVSGTNRRHSVLPNGQPSTGMKRTSNGAGLGSSLPRTGAGRSVSGKPDLASAAAIASLRPKQ